MIFHSHVQLPDGTSISDFDCDKWRISNIVQSELSATDMTRGDFSSSRPGCDLDMSQNPWNPLEFTLKFGIYEYSTHKI